MAPHSSTLAWKIPWAEESGRLQSMGSRRVRHDWASLLSLSCIGKGNGNPLQCSCLENPRDGGAWGAAIYGVPQSRIRLKRLSSSTRNKEGLLPSTRDATVNPLCSQYSSQSDPLEMKSEHATSQVKNVQWQTWGPYGGQPGPKCPDPPSSWTFAHYPLARISSQKTLIIYHPLLERKQQEARDLCLIHC